MQILCKNTGFLIIMQGKTEKHTDLRRVFALMSISKKLATVIKDTIGIYFEYFYMGLRISLIGLIISM